MNVLVNAVAARRGHGSSSLARYIRALADAMPDSQFDVFVTPDFSERVGGERVAWIEVDVPQGINARRLVWDNVRVPWRSRNYDAVLSPLNFGPIVSLRPHVLLQRNILYFDRTSLAAQSVRQRMRMAGYRWLAVAGMNTASAVIAPSHAMADTLSRYLLNKSKLRVAWHGLDRERLIDDASIPMPHQAVPWLSADIRLLHVGVPSPHKGLDCLARTLAEVKTRAAGQAVKLAVTFDADPVEPAAIEFCGQARALGIWEDVCFLGALPNKSVLSVYASAHVLLLPSTCESFGFTVLEALASGTAVVASDIPALREVGGGHVRHHAVGDARVAASNVLQAIDAPFIAARCDVQRWVANFTTDSEVAVAATALRSHVVGPSSQPVVKTTNDAAVRVVMFNRRPLPGHYSLERVFDDVRGAMPPGIAVEAWTLPFASTGVVNRFRNMLFARRHKGDVNHVTGDVHYLVLALPRSNTILTIADLVGIHRLSGLRRALLNIFWYRLPVWWCRNITVISEATQTELAALLPWAANKTTVVGCPVSSAFAPSPMPSGPVPVILQVGTGHNKNLLRVIESLAGLPVSLRIVGRLTSEMQGTLDRSGVAWSATCDLADADLQREYANADIVMFASTYEGFGLPILEAQATGRTVITSDMTPMRDVAGDGAALVDPHDTDSIRRAVVRLIDHPNLCRELVEKGFRNVARFGPGSVAASYASVYRMVAASMRHRNRVLGFRCKSQVCPPHPSGSDQHTAYPSSSCARVSTYEASKVARGFQNVRRFAPGAIARRYIARYSEILEGCGPAQHRDQLVDWSGLRGGSSRRGHPEDVS